MSLSYYQCKKRKMYSYLNINILDIIMEQINLKCFIDFVISFYPVKHTIMIKCRCFLIQYFVIYQCQGHEVANQLSDIFFLREKNPICLVFDLH